MPLDRRPIAVLWNAAAGWDEGAEQAERVQEILSEGGHKVDLHSVNKGDDIVAEGRRQVASGAEVLVAAGGDGTVNAVATALLNTETALAVIPAGTLNHFARDLSIPLDPESAARSIRDGHEITVDVGSVNGRIFINNSVLGLYPVYRAAREAYERRGLGSNRITRFFAVVRAMARVFWHMPHLHLSIETEDGLPREVKTPFVLVANNEHEVENWNIGHRRSLNKGHLWVYVMRRCSRWAVLRFFAAFIMKRFSRYDAFDIYHAKAVQVSARSQFLRVGIDGEIVRMQTPLQYESLPGSLRVIAPPAYKAEIE